MVKKKLGKVVIPIIIILLIVMFSVLIGSKVIAKPYKKMLDEYVSLINKECTDEESYYYALMADSRVKIAKKMEKAWLKSEIAKEEAEETKERIEDFYGDLEDEFGKWKLSYEIRSVKALDEKALKPYQKDSKETYKNYFKPKVKEYKEILKNKNDEIEDGADELEMSPKEYKEYIELYLERYENSEYCEITEGYELKLKFVIKTEDEEYETETLKAAVLKIDGGWSYTGIEPLSVEGWIDSEADREGWGQFSFENNMLDGLLEFINAGFIIS